MSTLVPPVIYLTIYLLLIAGGALIGWNSSHRRVVISLLSVATMLALVLALGGLPAPGNSWLMPAVPLFGIWLVVGMLTGRVALFAKANRLLATLLVVAAILILLTLLGGSLELGNPNLGWGLYAIPPIAAGALLTYQTSAHRRGHVMYIFGWIVVVSILALPHYLMEMDLQELSRAYAGVTNTATYVQSEVVVTVIYLVGSLMLLVLPLLLDRIRIQQRQQRHNIATA